MTRWCRRADGSEAGGETSGECRRHRHADDSRRHRLPDRPSPPVHPPRREWEQLTAVAPRCVARARSWHVTHAPFRSLDELLRLAGFKSPHSRKPTTCCAASSSSPPTTRSPPASSCSASSRACSPSCARNNSATASVDALDLLAAEAWLAIVTYRADRPPHRRRRPAAQRRPPPRLHHPASPPGSRSREDVVPPASLDLPRLPAARLVVRGADDRAARGAPRRAYRRRSRRRPRLPVGGDGQRARRSGNVTARTLRNRRRRAIERIRQLAA